MIRHVPTHIESTTVLSDKENSDIPPSQRLPFQSPGFTESFDIISPLFAILYGQPVRKKILNHLFWCTEVKG